MQLYVSDPLFAWARLEDHPHLSTLRQLLEVLPDQDLLDGLEAARGKGRDDFPVGVLWGVVVFTVALRHPSFASCIAELNRNPALYRLLGISCVAGIPKDYNISRFVDVLGCEPHHTNLRKVFDVLVQRLGHAVPDLAAVWSRLDSFDLRLAELAKLLTELKSEIATVIDHARRD